MKYNNFDINHANWTGNIQLEDSAYQHRKGYQHGLWRNILYTKCHNRSRYARSVQETVMVRILECKTGYFPLCMLYIQINSKP